MEDAPNIDVKPGQGGRLVYDKARRTIVAVAPFLPCPICKGIEGCDHTVPERTERAKRKLADELESFKTNWWRHGTGHMVRVELTTTERDLIVVSLRNT